MNNNLIYGIKDKPKTLKELFLYSLQQLLSIIVATILIANICGTPVSSCLLGACVGTLIYQIITKFRSPMFISSCGATCSAVIGALALSPTKNYLMVAVGGFVIFLVYTLFALLIKIKGIEILDKLFPATIVGPVTMVIGLNLATFIPTYMSVNGQHSDLAILVGLLTAIVIAITSHYGKGFIKTIPFLVGLLFGYILSLLITLFTPIKLIDFSVFSNLSWIPEFTFLQWSTIDFSWSNILQTIILFLPVAICALLEHYSDHKCLSNIIGTDLTKEPGLTKTLLGDGLASFIGTILCGLPNTSYGESIATTGFSKVASTFVITVSALMLGLLAFIAPVQAFIASIPSCIFGGCAIILYGYIAISGLKLLINSKVNLEDTKNMILVCSILTIGVSGTYFLSSSFAGVSLAMVFGVVLNLILKNVKK